MPSIRDVIQQTDESDKQFEQAIIVIRCKLIGVDDDESASVDGRNGYVWVRRYNDAYGVFQVFNGNTVNPIVGLPVLVELSSGQHKYMVIGIDYGLAEGDDYEVNELSDVHLKHAATHEWPNTEPGTDAVSVYMRALVPLKTYPYSGMVVGVAEARYSYNGRIYQFGNTYINLTDYIPAAGYTLMVLVVLDPSVHTIKLILSDSVVSTLTPDYPDIPAGYIPSGYVQLTGSMTEVREAQIRDARVILHTPGANMQELYCLLNDLEKELTIHQIYGDEI